MAKIQSNFLYYLNQSLLFMNLALLMKLDYYMVK